MTFFQPEQKSFLNYAIAGLVLASFFASIFLIFIYNRSVNLEYKIYAAEENIKKLEGDKSQLQEKIFSLLSDASLKKFAADRNLVQEKNPKYLVAPSGAVENLAISQTR